MSGSARGALCARRRGRGTALFMHADMGIPRAWANAAPAPIPMPGPVWPESPIEGAVLVVVETMKQTVGGAVAGLGFAAFTGMFARRSRQVIFAEMRKMSSQLAVYSGVYTAVSTTARLIRRKDDRNNALLGSCSTGIVMYSKAGPRAALQGCATFAGISYAIDLFLASKEDKPPSNDSLSTEEILRKPL